MLTLDVLNSVKRLGIYTYFTPDLKEVVTPNRSFHVVRCRKLYRPKSPVICKINVIE